MNKSMIRYLLSKLLLIEACLLLVPVVIAVIYQEPAKVFLSFGPSSGPYLLSFLDKFQILSMLSLKLAQDLLQLVPLFSTMLVSSPTLCFSGAVLPTYLVVWECWSLP